MSQEGVVWQLFFPVKSRLVQLDLVPSPQEQKVPRLLPSVLFFSDFTKWAFFIIVVCHCVFLFPASTPGHECQPSIYFFYLPPQIRDVAQINSA